jgi:hypothetical protein
MTVDVFNQDFFIYVPARENVCETSSLLPVAPECGSQVTHIDVLDETWVKIPLQDQLVVYARLGNEADV